METIIIFASGNGTNAQAIVEYTRSNPGACYRVAGIVCDNPRAGVIARAAALEIPVQVVRRADLASPQFIQSLRSVGASCLVLAGFLGLIPAGLVQAFPGRILNLHPALLPKYGGKGMYGDNVHRAVLAAAEPFSGITVHVIDERYDCGTNLCQVSCPVYPSDTPHTLAERIHRLEHRYYPVVIDDFVSRPR